ncbi:monothiol glutaredoxin-5, mitochondrial precursor [Tribonema minus]|uniref:Monothiol glutaredoxin-5, mitochondrial n=1 Tax=Tribonema minus TaxID=303371 RepID=A0A835Z0J8_9STRA|nr:monothiol glutaredoxin-5, mitochondrial precursor [Tribonema minus]
MQAVRAFSRSGSQLRRPCLTAARSAVAATRAFSTARIRPAVAVAAQHQWRQARSFAASSQDKDSDDDFKPKRKEVPEGDAEIHDMIAQQVRDNKLMVYMKGTPSAPACGFSMQVVRILHAQGVDFSSINILDYPAIREGVKKFSDWPTIPQVYLNGEFVGGCDIMTQMHKSGELETMLKEAGLVQGK